MPLPPLFAPDFPSFIQDPGEKQVKVYWYHPDFTQSRYPPGQEISQACTLICILVAQQISRSRIIIWDVKQCPNLDILIAEAIIEGNKTHAWIVKNGLTPHPYLNTNEALKFGGSTLKEWKFRVYREKIEQRLCRNIESFLYEWYTKPKAETLFMLLITCGRTVLFIFQQQSCKVTLFDSHAHRTPRNSNRGLVIAQAQMEKLEELCYWYIDAVLSNCFNAQADQYELAFLYENCSSTCSSNKNSACDCGCLDC